VEDAVIIAGIVVSLALLAFLVAGEAREVCRSSVVRPTRRRVLVGVVLATGAAALVLPRLVDLLV
jgi:hypothetical protein